jgi:hypothetical protein
VVRPVFARRGKTALPDVRQFVETTDNFSDTADIILAQTPEPGAVLAAAGSLNGNGSAGNMAGGGDVSIGSIGSTAEKN